MNQTNISHILRGEDIEGLISAGAPQDEYDHESAEIASLLKDMPADKITRDTVHGIITFVWAKSFDLLQADMPRRDAAFFRVADKILAFNSPQ